MIIEFRDSGLSIDNGRLVIEGGSPIIETAVQILEAADYGETEFTLVGFPGEMLAALRQAFAARNPCCPGLKLQIVGGGER